MWAREKWQRLKQLKADKDRVILTADKGVALVILEKKDYIEKTKQLLQDTNTYRTIQADPTTKLKNRFDHQTKEDQAGYRIGWNHI